MTCGRTAGSGIGPEGSTGLLSVTVRGLYRSSLAAVALAGAVCWQLGGQWRSLGLIGMPMLLVGPLLPWRYTRRLAVMVIVTVAVVVALHGGLSGRHDSWWVLHPLALTAAGGIATLITRANAHRRRRQRTPTTPTAVRLPAPRRSPDRHPLDRPPGIGSRPDG